MGDGAEEKVVITRMGSKEDERNEQAVKEERIKSAVKNARRDVAISKARLRSVRKRLDRAIKTLDELVEELED